MAKMIFEGVWLSVMGIVDIRYRKIPLWLLGMGAPAAAAAMIGRWRECGLHTGGLLGACVPGIILLLAGAAKKAGYGDGLTLLLLGLMNEGTEMMKLFLVSLLVMSLPALVLLALHRVKKDTRLPYLPFLALAWFAGRILS